MIQECRRRTCEECDEILHLVDANKTHTRVPLFTTRASQSSRAASQAQSRNRSPRCVPVPKRNFPVPSSVAVVDCPSVLNSGIKQILCFPTSTRRRWLFVAACAACAIHHSPHRSSSTQRQRLYVPSPYPRAHPCMACGRPLCLEHEPVTSLHSTKTSLWRDSVLTATHATR